MMAAAVCAPSGVEQVRTAGRKFPRRTESVPTARAFTRNVLNAWHVPSGTVDDAETIVAELAANAAVHVPPNGDAMTVGLAAWNGRLRITVSDPGLMCDRVKPCRTFSQDECGRGLAIVKELAQRFGCERVSFGKVVFAELRIGGAV